MDREQAVKYLQSSGFSEEQIKAIEGAFTCDKCVYSTSEGCQYDDITEAIPPFEDCISRQAVIDCFKKWQPYMATRLWEFEQKLSALPSVGSSENPNKCEDAVSRQAAIDAIYARYIGGKEAVDKAPANDQYAEGIDEAVCAVEGLPPVNPQPKTDWIVPIILIDEKGEEHDGLMDKRRMLIYLHNIPAETAISLGYTWKSAEGSDKE